MLSELKKSTSAILHQRVTSPLYGTLIISWLFWNWKIIYLTLFIDESSIKGTKIDFIVANYSNPLNHFIYPFISAAIIIVLIPFVANGAFWLSLKFKKWRLDQKNEIEKKQLLTIEQSIALRSEIREKELGFEKILEKVEQEKEELNKISVELQEEVNRLKSALDKKAKTRTSQSSSSGYGPEDYEGLKNNTRIFEPFEEIAKSVKNHNIFPKKINERIKEYYLINGIVEEDVNVNPSGEFYYKLTFKGEGLYRDFFNELFNSQAGKK